MIWNLLALAFGAGGAYFLLKHTKKDVNGLGQKVRGEMSRAATRHQNVTVALMLLASDEQKAKIADLLRESHEDKTE